MTNDNQKRKTVNDISASKNNLQPLVCLTAYSAPMAQALDNYCDVLLVGDSLGMALYGMDSTLGVTLDMMINHGKAVMRGSEKAFVVVDMPYGTYEDNIEDAYDNAARIMETTGCCAIKLEGGTEMANTITHLSARDIPVMGHIGLKPQSVEKEGGYKIKGKTDSEISALLADAQALENAGAFSMVIEGTIETVSKQITESISIPTIGIGASAACDGQILVTEDMLGLLYGHTPKFAKQYAQIRHDIEQAVKQYAEDVRSRAFPTADYLYTRSVKKKAG